jgi:hypothetical protein
MNTYGPQAIKLLANKVVSYENLDKNYFENLKSISNFRIQKKFVKLLACAQIKLQFFTQDKKIQKKKC